MLNQTLPQLTREAYTLKEIAGSIIPLSVRSLQRDAEAGRLATIKLRGRRLVRRADLERYLASATGGGVTTPSDAE